MKYRVQIKEGMCQDKYLEMGIEYGKILVADIELDTHERSKTWPNGEGCSLVKESRIKMVFENGRELYYYYIGPFLNDWTILEAVEE